jgi:hypothetical protein
MDISLYSTIRTPHVNAGAAPMLQSARIFSDWRVCPQRSNISDSGVIGVARDSINTLTAGCNSAMSRVTVENSLRPRYSSYLNVDQGLAGVGYDDSLQTTDFANQNAPYYDTMLSGRMVRESVAPYGALHPFYDIASAPPAAGVAPGDVAFLKSQDEVACIADSRYENRGRKCLNQ